MGASLASNPKRSSMPMEESSKLNVLIEEYRRENDRCSRRINELQRKLNATAQRRIRNETTPSASYQPPNLSSNNKGNKKGGSKSPIQHYPHHGQRYGRDEHNDQSPERST